VRNALEMVICNQSQRLGKLTLRKTLVTDQDYKILMSPDTIGQRPDFSDSPVMRKLNVMVGLEHVKRDFRQLMFLAAQNFDREMRGESPERISLHRVFYGLTH